MRREARTCTPLSGRQAIRSKSPDNSTKSPDTVPMDVHGTSFVSHTLRRSFSRSGARLTTIRDCPSPNRAASQRSPSGASTRAPTLPAIAHSDMATARPPSEQSCADLTTPEEISSRHALCTATSRSRSMFGWPSTSPCTSSRYSLPARSAGSATSESRPSSTIRSPSSLKPTVACVVTSSVTPSAPTTGVG